MNKLIRFLFFNVIVRFVTHVVVGLNVRHRDRLPQDGPAIIVANHNSHLDTMVLMTLLPMKLLPKIKPAAAFDYFMSSTLMRWFSLKIIGIVPVKRKRNENDNTDPLAGCKQALEQGNILIFFPEGSRGEPEQLAEFKSGIYRLAETHPNVPIIPVYLHGLGKSLPRGESLLVPFFCDVFVGEPLPLAEDKAAFMATLEQGMAGLAAEGDFAPWE